MITKSWRDEAAYPHDQSQSVEISSSKEKDSNTAHSNLEIILIFGIKSSCNIFSFKSDYLSALNLPAIFSPLNHS